MTKATFDRCLFSLIILLGPFSITQWNKPFLVLILILSCMLLASMSMSDRGLSLHKTEVMVVGLYLTILAIGFVTLLISHMNPYGMLIDSNTLGRVFTVSVLSTMLVSGLSYMNSLDDIKFRALKNLFIIPGLIFALFGIYQTYCNYIGISFVIETRDWMHGVPANIRDVFPKRITSIAEEPSFLAPILVEFLILCFFLIERKWLKYSLLAMTLVLLLMTFSGGAYVNISLILFIAIVILLWKFPFGRLHLGVLVLVIACSSFLVIYGETLIDYVFTKLTHEASGGSSRGQFTSNLIGLFVSADTFSLMFGHGLTSLTYLSDFGMKTEDVIFRISNNMFIDIGWESGLIGVLLTIAMYGVLFTNGMKIQIGKSASLSLSLLLVFQLLITSLYRSEYISTHFIWMLILIFWVLRYEKLSLPIDMNHLNSKKGYE
ncbi:MAG: hypothetical protein ACI9VT_000797 [Psychroserpens sp.]|jgi:hypothetical protein